MADEQNKGLFRVIIQRIGLEKTLMAIRKKVSVSEVALILLVVLFVLVSVILTEELVESSLFVFLSLMFTNPGETIRFGGSYANVILESIPGIALALSLALLGLALVIIRLLAKYFTKIIEAKNNINKLLRIKK